MDERTVSFSKVVELMGPYALVELVDPHLAAMHLTEGEVREQQVTIRFTGVTPVTNEIETTED